jgi:hypothetical protein
MAEDAASGLQWTARPTTIEYVFDCLWCLNVFGPSPTTGPTTGWGNMGMSYGLNVQCPRCGSTNCSGPRLRKRDEKVPIYPATSVVGVAYFTGEAPEAWVSDDNQLDTPRTPAEDDE